MNIGLILFFILSKLLKARTHRPILKRFAAESAVESADSIPESADSTTDFTIAGRLSISNMFNILNILGSAKRSRPTVGGGGGVSKPTQEIGPVGTGLNIYISNFLFLKSLISRDSLLA